jgi:enoyl-CoA hydratase/carnithine racemase
VSDDRPRGARGACHRRRAGRRLPADELLERALDLASEIAAMPGDGIRLTGRTISGALTQTHAEAIEAELVAQREAYRNPVVQQAFADFFAR